MTLQCLAQIRSVEATTKTFLLLNGNYKYWSFHIFYSLLYHVIQPISKDFLSETILIAAPSMLTVHCATVLFIMVFGLCLTSAPWKLAMGRTTVALKKVIWGNSVAVQWSGLQAFTVVRCEAKKKKKKEVILACEHR